MTLIVLGNHARTVDATEVGDLDTQQALAHAASLHEQGVEFREALVDRFDGLVLVGDEPQSSYHYRTPLCGYVGSGPMATTVILEMFGFGTHEEIMNKISTGDDKAYALFRR